MKQKKRTTLPRVTVLSYNRRDLVAFVQAVETLRLLVEDLRAVARDLGNATVPITRARDRTAAPASVAHQGAELPELHQGAELPDLPELPELPEVFPQRWRDMLDELDGAVPVPTAPTPQNVSSPPVSLQASEGRRKAKKPKGGQP